MDAQHAGVCASQRQLFSLIAEADQCKAWRDSGVWDMAHWLWMRYGISDWKARRWIAAAHALEGLPQISEAFASGELGIDKVVELTRFATAETEGRLITWAQGGVLRSDQAQGGTWPVGPSRRPTRPSRPGPCPGGTSPSHRGSGCPPSSPRPRGRWWPRHWSVWQGSFRSCRGERMAGAWTPGGPTPWWPCARPASAPTPILTGPPWSSTPASRGSLKAREGVRSREARPSTPRPPGACCCTGRVQTVIEDRAGHVVGLGRVTREPPEWMIRQLKYRDLECRFPGCGARRFTQAHHIVWWEHGGATDLDNLVLVCSFHHKLVHEYGWGLKRGGDGSVKWFHPDGTRYRAGPAPPRETPEPELAIS